MPVSAFFLQPGRASPALQLVRRLADGILLDVCARPVGGLVYGDARPGGPGNEFPEILSVHGAPIAAPFSLKTFFAHFIITEDPEAASHR